MKGDRLSSFQIDQIHACGSLTNQKNWVVLYVEFGVGSHIVEQIRAFISTHSIKLERQDPSLGRIVYNCNVSIDLT